MTIIDGIYGYVQGLNVQAIHPHRLALLFGILSVGSLRNMECGLSEINATRYHVLACSAISLAPIISEASCVTVQAIFTIHAFLASKIRGASEENWLLVGIMTRLGHRVSCLRTFSSLYLSLCTDWSP